MKSFTKLLFVAFCALSMPVAAVTTFLDPAAKRDIKMLDPITLSVLTHKRAESYSARDDLALFSLVQASAYNLGAGKADAISKGSPAEIALSLDARGTQWHTSFQKDQHAMSQRWAIRDYLATMADPAIKDLLAIANAIPQRPTAAEMSRLNAATWTYLGARKMEANQVRKSHEILLDAAIRGDPKEMQSIGPALLDDMEFIIPIAPILYVGDRTLLPGGANLPFAWTTSEDEYDTGLFGEQADRDRIEAGYPRIGNMQLALMRPILISGFRFSAAPQNLGIAFQSCGGVGKQRVIFPLAVTANPCQMAFSSTPAPSRLWIGVRGYITDSRVSVGVRKELLMNFQNTPEILLLDMSERRIIASMPAPTKQMLDASGYKENPCYGMAEIGAQYLPIEHSTRQRTSTCKLEIKK